MTTLRDAAQALLDAWDSMQIATDHADDGYALFEALRAALSLPDAGWEAGAAATREAMAKDAEGCGFVWLPGRIRDLPLPPSPVTAPEAKTAEGGSMRGPAMLPEGKRCADCFHIARCLMLGYTRNHNVVCDWSPSRFATQALHQAPAPVEPEETQR